MTTIDLSLAGCIGLGQEGRSGKQALIRGGNWDNGANAGVFALNANNGPSNWNNNIGFRCGRGERPDPARPWTCRPSIPPYYVAVPFAPRGEKSAPPRRGLVGPAARAVRRENAVARSLRPSLRAGAERPSRTVWE